MRLAATWDAPLEVILDEARREDRERAGVERLDAPKPRVMARRMMPVVKRRGYGVSEEER